MIIGFTGTQLGMTTQQILTVTRILKQFVVTKTHHGDCIGADEQFDSITAKMHLNTVVHPPSNSKKRAFCNLKIVNDKRIILRPKSYKERNRDIVNASDLLVAAPHHPEHLRSGTWSTVRYARERNKTIIIVEP